MIDEVQDLTPAQLLLVLRTLKVSDGIYIVRRFESDRASEFFLLESSQNTVLAR